MAVRSLIATISGKAPREFRIWRSGVNDTSKGPINFTPRSAQLVMDEYQKIGRKLAIDLEHGSNPQANPDFNLNDPPPMGGYFSIALRGPENAPELWAVDVDWSNCGREFPEPGKVCCGKHQIESGQRRYFSPDIYFDEGTNEPTVLNKIALCAEPATYGIQLLSKYTRLLKRFNVNEQDFLKALMAACAGATSLQDPDVAALCEALMGQVKEVAAAKGYDLSAPAPEAAPPSEAPAPVQAAESAPEEEKKVMGDAQPEKKDEPAMVSKALTTLDVQKMLKEDRERQALLSANAELLGGFAPLLADKPLDEVKRFVVAAKLRAPKLMTQESKAPRGEQETTTGAATKSEKTSLVQIYSKREAERKAERKN